MKVLFATDGRPPAVAAGDLLMRLADPSRVKVTILSAHDMWPDGAERNLDKAQEEAADSLRRARLSAETLMVEGDPAIAIEKEVAENSYELVALGGGNHSWFGRLVFGSVSTHLLYGTPIPILVVHRAPDPDHDRLRVLVGVDGSPSAAHAIDLLDALTDPERIDIRVRTVIPSRDLAFAAHPGAVMPSSHVQETIEEEEAKASGHLEDALERLRELGFDPLGSIGRGWPGNDLLERAEEENADLVVVGARGIGAIARLTMGSVSSHVARHAPATLVGRTGYQIGDEGIEEPNGHASWSRFHEPWA